MSINVQEDKLFDEWEKKREYLVRDGVVNVIAYKNEPKKIMFVLKEVNDKNGGGWDLREFIRDGARGQTWNNVTRWAYGLKNYKKKEPWETIIYINKKDRIELLAPICAFNLKKTPGGATADNEVVSRIAREDREYLNKQFSLYSPDIVICCGKTVSQTFQDVIDIPSVKPMQVTKNGIRFCKFETGKFIIEYIHPQARVCSESMYANLLEAYEEMVEG